MATQVAALLRAPAGGTNLSVTASTSQAVGAFSALTNAINRARTGFNGLGQATRTFYQGARPVHEFVSGRLLEGFHLLQTAVRGLSSVLSIVTAGVELLFVPLIRHMDKLQGFNSMMKVSTNDATESAHAYQFVRRTADELGIQFDATASNYAKLLAAIPDGITKFQDTELVFKGVANAARALHASTQDVNLMFFAVTQMASKGTVSMEELRRQLGERIPGVIQIAAKALNTTPELLEGAIRKGIVVSEKLLPILGAALTRTFGDAAQNSATAVSASIARLQNVWIDFTKNLLDTKVDRSISGVFDAITEKVSDPFIIARFGEVVKDMATKVSTFIRSLSQDDLRRGFDTFEKGLTIIWNLLKGVAKTIEWIINNGAAFTAIVSALAALPAGAALGAGIGSVIPGAGTLIGGSVGAIVTAVIAAIGGHKLGQQLEPTKAQQDAITQHNKAGEAARAQANRDQAHIALAMSNYLKNTFGLTVQDVPGLFTPERVNADTLAQLMNEPMNRKNAAGKLMFAPGTTNKDGKFVPSQQQITSIKEFEKFNQWLPPNAGNQLSDVFGGRGKDKKDHENERRIDAANKFLVGGRFDRGLNADFNDQWERLNKMFTEGFVVNGQKVKLTIDELNQAQAKLLQQQPFMRDQMKEEADGLKDIDFLMKNYVEAKETIWRALDLERNALHMTSEEREVEEELFRRLEPFRKKHVELSEESTQALRKEITELVRFRGVQKQIDDLMRSGPNRMVEQDDRLDAMQILIDDPKRNFSRDDARIQLSQDPFTAEMMVGTDATTKFIERRYTDMFNFIEKLRARDLLSEGEANRAKKRLMASEVEAKIKAEIDKQAAIRQANDPQRTARINLLQNSDAGPALALTSAPLENIVEQYKRIFDSINEMERNGVMVTAEAVRAKIGMAEQLRQAILNTQIDLANNALASGIGGWAEGVISVLGRLQTSFTTISKGMTDAFGDFFVQLQDGFANSVGRAIVYSENLGDAIDVVAKEAVAGLISALIKLGIQWMVNAVLSKTLGAASVAASATMGAAVAKAWAPAAAMASLASFGQNAIPASIGIFGTVALSKALASTPGFDQGGYTGDLDPKNVAGVVHGREFVINADQTQKYRPLLEAINRGADVQVPGYETGGYVGTTPFVPMAPSRAARSDAVPEQTTGGDVYFTIENHGADIVRQETRRENGDRDVKLIVRAAVAEVTRQIGNGGPVAQALKNKGLNMSSSLARRN